MHPSIMFATVAKMHHQLLTVCKHVQAFAFHVLAYDLQGSSGVTHLSLLLFVYLCIVVWTCAHVGLVCVDSSVAAKLPMRHRFGSLVFLYGACAVSSPCHDKLTCRSCV